MKLNFETRLKQIIKYHLNKVLEFDAFFNFPGVNSIEEFIKIIRNDPAFEAFHLDREKYATARFGGNLITSLHRKIGDLYEDLTKEIIAEKLKISRESLEYSLELTINNQVQTRSTDGKILINEISDPEKKEKVKNIIEQGMKGIALEVRSCYQIGDSKRIQADRDMALALRNISIEPVMLVYCITSLKSPIIRLKKYWNLKEGLDSFNYLKELTGFDLYNFLLENKNYIKEMMDAIFDTF